MTRTLRNAFISITIAHLMMLAMAVLWNKHEWIWAAFGGLIAILAVLICWGVNERIANHAKNKK